MIVRAARREDLVQIGRVAEAAHWSTYGALLAPTSIGGMLSERLGPSALARRLLRGGAHVVLDDRAVVGFADAIADDGATHIEVIVVEPAWRRRGVGTALLAAVASGAELPVSADVLLGNLEGEAFYEANGFVPGEVIHRRLYEEDIVERRWWRETKALGRGLKLAVGPR